MYSSISQWETREESHVNDGEVQDPQERTQWPFVTISFYEGALAVNRTELMGRLQTATAVLMETTNIMLGEYHSTAPI